MYDHPPRPWILLVALRSKLNLPNRFLASTRTNFRTTPAAGSTDTDTPSPTYGSGRTAEYSDAEPAAEFTETDARAGRSRSEPSTNATDTPANSTAARHDKPASAATNG